MYRMVFDVESIGLHGEGFAVGWVVIDGDGKHIDQGLISCQMNWASGTWFDHDWVAANVTTDIPDGLPIYGLCQSPKDVRDLFWQQWMRWKAEGAELWADCAWPVEARFLIECIEDDKGRRTWDGPYPLHEIATLMMANGRDPLKTYDREESELPVHNPLMDARQSARLLHELLYRRVDNGRTGNTVQTDTDKDSYNAIAGEGAD